MKTILKSTVLHILTWAARRRLARLRRGGVRVIGVTGSIGKTTCKEAIAFVLQGQLRVLKSDKSYNTEIGLPLTILGLKSEFSSVFGWIKNLLLAIWRALFDDTQYDALVLEMGVDKPGDMDTLLTISRPDIGVFMGVHPVHMADGQFDSLDAIFTEKAKLIRAVPPTGTIFLNQDDERCAALAREMGSRSDSPKIITFGATERAKLHVSDVMSGWDGLRFSAHYGDVKGAFLVPILGKQHISSLLPAIGCGLSFGMYMEDIVTRLRDFSLPPGRLSLIKGIHHSWIVDSTYNASPDAVRAALDTLTELATAPTTADRTVARRLFIFGNMNELGESSENEHREISAYISGKVDVLITVGESARLCADEALSQYILPKERVISFATTEEAMPFVQKLIQKNDLVLVKGSQNKVRLERLTKAIMAHPEDAPKLLVRQEWKS